MSETTAYNFSFSWIEQDELLTEALSRVIIHQKDIRKSFDTIRHDIS